MILPFCYTLKLFSSTFSFKLNILFLLTYIIQTFTHLSWYVFTHDFEEIYFVELKFDILMVIVKFFLQPMILLNEWQVSIYRETSWALGGLGPIYLFGLDLFACWIWTWIHLSVGLELELICLLGLCLEFDTFFGGFGLEPICLLDLN